MKDLAIAIRVGSPKSRLDLVRMTLESLRRYIGDCDWKVFLSVGEKIPAEVEDLVLSYTKSYPQHYEIFHKGEVFWADFINQAIALTRDYRYFIKAHDDIRLDTMNFFAKVTATLKDIGREVGWISFTDPGWRIGYFMPPAREGYHLDFVEENGWVRRKLFQYASFPENWWMPPRHEVEIYNRRMQLAAQGQMPKPHFPVPIDRILTFIPEMPARPCRVHAPFNHFVMIERAVLEKIGPCENWGTMNALLVDEDWGLRSLQLNIPNIWIPDVEYLHYREPEFVGGGSRSIVGQDNALAARVHQRFKDKWGFNATPTAEQLNELRQRYAGTLIPWSIGRRSYEYDLL